MSGCPFVVNKIHKKLIIQLMLNVLTSFIFLSYFAPKYLIEEIFDFRRAVSFAGGWFEAAVGPETELLFSVVDTMLLPPLFEFSRHFLSSLTQGTRL